MITPKDLVTNPDALWKFLTQKPVTKMTDAELDADMDEYFTVQDQKQAAERERQAGAR